MDTETLTEPKTEPENGEVNNPDATLNDFNLDEEVKAELERVAQSGTYQILLLTSGSYD